MQPKLETPQVTCNKLAGVSFGQLTKVKASAPELNLQHPCGRQAYIYLLIIGLHTNIGMRNDSTRYWNIKLTLERLPVCYNLIHELR